MDEKNHGAGAVEKSAYLAPQEITEEELAAINRYTLAPLTAEEVFTFKAVLCDNEVDRHHERFSLSALSGLQSLFVGKTVIKDHSQHADNQVARIYATELQQHNRPAPGGEMYTQLVARCYMVKTAGNADLIAEIKAGIKKEVSVGCAIEKAICGICGTDNVREVCRHWPGAKYQTDEGEKVCTFTLDGAADAYEFSLVTVPAQKEAGVCKTYSGKPIYKAAAEEKDLLKQAKKIEIKARAAQIAAKNAKKETKNHS